jgi:hypothetical protein
MVWALGASRLLEVRLLHALGTGGSVRGGHKRGQLHFCPYCVSIPVLVFVTLSCSLCRANAAACHDRRPRRDSEDSRARRASGRAGRPASPVRPLGSASRAARAAGAPRRDPVGVSRARAPVEVCAASPPPACRGAGLTGPTRDDRIGPRCQTVHPRCARARELVARVRERRLCPLRSCGGRCSAPVEGITAEEELISRPKPSDRVPHLPHHCRRVHAE